uniref:VPS13 domain-containing protein n=1 Tax=Macrostomum lignano TaxID=282301 RepID=A0A1I8FM67_9PLAT
NRWPDNAAPLDAALCSHREPPAIGRTRGQLSRLICSAWIPARPTCTLAESLCCFNSALEDRCRLYWLWRACWLRELRSASPAAWGPPDGAGLAAFAIDSAMEKARLEAAAPEVVVSSVRDGAGSKGEPPHSPASTVAQRTRVLQALVGELGFALDELDWILSASAVLHHRRLQSVESFRLVASRLRLLSR